MRLALSEISTVNASFHEDVAAYAEAGFDAIGVWEFKLAPDDEANLELLRESGLAVANCVPAVPSVLQLRVPGLEGPVDPEERIEALCTSLRRLSRYEPESVLCLTGPAGELREDETRSLVIDGLRRVAAAAAETGVRLGLEPAHHSQREETSIVHSLAEAAELLAEAELADVGMMVDTYHVWDTPTLFEDLERHAERVTGLHVADWPSLDRTDRVLPGEGISRTREIVDRLRRDGFDGSLDVEIFSTPDRFWGLPVGEAARRAHAAAARLL